MIDVQTVISRSPDPVTAMLDGRVMMLSVETGRYFALDAVSSRIWELIDSPRRIGDLCGDLVKEFDVSEERCRAELCTFAERMRDLRLIQVSSASPP